MAVAPSTADAASWTFDTASLVSTTGPSGITGGGDANRSETRTYQGSDGSLVTVSGWGNTISSNTQLELGLITHFNGGLGVTNADGPRGQDTGEGSSPEHAIDNNQRFDLVLFDFGDQNVDLSDITLGWWFQDTDLTLLAYKGMLDPTDDAGADYIGSRTLTGSSEDLTTHGWSVIGSHDVDDTDPNAPSAPNPTSTDVNSGDMASNYWIVLAYNEVFAGLGDETPDPTSLQSDFADYFKILTLNGDVVPPPPGPVPVPAAAWMGMVMLSGMGGLRVAQRLRTGA